MRKKKKIAFVRVKRFFLNLARDQSGDYNSQSFVNIIKLLGASLVRNQQRLIVVNIGYVQQFCLLAYFKKVYHIYSENHT